MNVKNKEEEEEEMRLEYKITTKNKKKRELFALLFFKRNFLFFPFSVMYFFQFLNCTKKHYLTT